MEEDFPTPQPPIEGEDYDANSTSKATMSLGETKRKLAQLWDFIAQFTRRTITSRNGTRFEIMAIELGPDDGGYRIMWEVLEGEDTGIYKIRLGTLDGCGLSGSLPVSPIGEVMDLYQFNGDPNTRQEIGLEVEFEPTSVEVDLTSQDTYYKLGDGGQEASYSVYLSAQAFSFAPTYPVIDTNTGFAVVNGKFRIPIAYLGGGDPIEQIRLGPITCYFCAPTSFGAISDGSQYQLPTSEISES